MWLQKVFPISVEYFFFRPVSPFSAISLCYHIPIKTESEESIMLGSRIASLRHGYGLSQAELARRLHISPSAIGMYEQGRREPSVDILIALAKEFGVTLDYLLSGQPDSIRDVSALHRQATSVCAASGGAELSREEMVCHLLMALLN
jgi:transcriptional regulator with XRE-family HTH domain